MEQIKNKIDVLFNEAFKQTLLKGFGRSWTAEDMRNTMEALKNETLSIIDQHISNPDTK